MIQSEHAPELRAQITAAMEQGRSGMAALITGADEDSLDEETVRSLGSVQMALMSGVMIQWLMNPATAPSAEQIAAGIRALTAPRATP
jgi:transcriptional regulator MftR-like protein